MQSEITYIPVTHNPFASGEIDKVAPATESQKEIYVSTLIGGMPANLAYNESVNLQFNGAINADLLALAFKQLIARHEALRSCLSKNGESIIIYKDVAFNLEILNIAQHTPQEHQIEILRQREVNTPFELNVAPLFRSTLTTQNNGHCLLTITGHHVIFDGWSIGVVLQDLSKIYTALVNGKTPELAVAAQISDYSKAEVAFLSTKTYKELETFWLDKLKTSDLFFELPTDYKRDGKRSYASARLDFSLSQETVLSIKKIGQEAGSTLVTSFLVAFEILISKISGTHNIIVGLPTSGQMATGNLNLVGHCVNLLPLKAQVNPENSYLDQLKLRKEEILDAYDHQRITFGTLLKDLDYTRDNSRIALVPVVFNIDLGYDNDVTFEKLDHQLSITPRTNETFEIFVNISGSESNLQVEWSYNTQLFKPETIIGFQAQFASLLEKIIRDPNAPIDTKPAQATNLKQNSNDNQSLSTKNLAQLIDETAQGYALKNAVIMGHESLTYQELVRKSNQLAHILQSKGIKTGSKIGFAVDRSVDLVIGLLAIVKLGACYLPLDPTYPTARINYMLADAEADFVITNATYAQHFKCDASFSIFEELLAEATSAPTDFYHRFDGNEVMYILHTSGSTGKPKGVQVTYNNVLNLLNSVKKRFGIADHDKMLAVTTISFDIAEVEIYLPLMSGATVQIASREDVRDAEKIISLLENQQITYMQATPSGWQMLLDAGWQTKLPLTILCGGEPMPKDLARQLLQRCDTLWNVYGPTETTIYSTVDKIEVDDETISIGKPLDDTRIYFLDENLNEVPAGEVGEIYIAGAGVSKGYINKPSLTNERYINLPQEKGKVYRTGDLGRIMPSGKIQCLGRVDHQVKIRGYRIELEEIEQVLNQLPNVQKAIVNPITLQPGNQQLIAYVIISPQNPQADQKALFKQWRNHLLDNLPPFMVPSFFKILEKFPLTPNGKIDRKNLPNPLTSSHLEQPKEENNLPNANETLIANIWKEALKLDSINITDNFFELGGHSLLAVQVMQKIEKATGVKLPLASLFEYPSAKALAMLLGKAEKEIKWNSLVNIKPEGNKTPLYLIHGTGLNVLAFHSIAKYVDKQQPVFGLQAQGLDGAPLNFENLSEIAKIYVDEILASNSEGPYALIGYSLGGIIAVEMAKQLKKLGKQVKLVGAVDTYIAKRDQNDRKFKKISEKIWRQPKKLLFFSGQFLKSPKETISYQLSHVKHLIDNILNMAKPIQLPSLEEQINEKYMDAYYNYNLTPYDDVVYLFKVQKRIYYVDEPKYLGWLPYAPKGLRVRNIPGDHATFFLPPNNKAAARVFQEALDQANA